MSKSEERRRYGDSIDPVWTDGRDVDTRLATLEGEAAQQEAAGADPHRRDNAPEMWDQATDSGARGITYYGQPMLKPSVWSIDIPLYYFVGGAAGAALTLGAALQLAAPGRTHELQRLSGLFHWIGIAGSTAGAGLLIHDLGRPSRFLAMVRVFRPTSPMNVGAWILGGAAPSAIATGLLLNRRGFPGKLGEFSGYVSGIFGAALATYTGVLVSNTAIPIWQASRRWLPVLFAASGGTTAISVVGLFRTGERARRLTMVFGTTVRVAEMAAALQVERSAGAVPEVGEPFHRGGSAVLWNAATGMTAASLAFSLFSRKSRKARIAAGLLGAAGSLCMRLAVHYLGEASARDPRASFAKGRSAR